MSFTFYFYACFSIIFNRLDYKFFLKSFYVAADLTADPAPVGDAGGDPTDWASIVFFIGALLHLNNFLSATMLDAVAIKIYFRFTEDEPTPKAKDQVCHSGRSPRFEAVDRTATAAIAAIAETTAPRLMVPCAD